MDSMPDFLSDFLNGLKRPTTKEMIDKYIKGIITKEELDKYMENKNGNTRYSK